MPLENLVIKRACLHEIYRRADDRSIVQPTFATHLLNLDVRGRSVFESRVLAAFRSGAKCMQMSIGSYGVESISSLGADLINKNDAEFIQSSRQFAVLLSSAQTSRQHPGGLVVVFDGTVGYPETKFFGVMKAETHEAFLKNNNLQATFVDSVFLSPKTKLYKIGIFVARENPAQALPGGWDASVYDSQLTAAERDGAALYFHEAFLGLRFPENVAQQTKKFYQDTREFIGASSIQEEQKVDLYNGLYAYLKLNRSSTIQVGDFAETYMAEDFGDSYKEFMRSRRFPEEAIPKDISEISDRMRIRKLRFTNQITLSGPAEAIGQLVDVDVINVDGEAARTRIMIRGRLESQI